MNAAIMHGWGDEVQGVVRVYGHHAALRTVQFFISDATPQLRLTGDGAAWREVGSLSGTHVKLLGRHHGNNEFEVGDYRILPIGGISPIVGYLNVTADAISIVEGDREILLYADNFRRHISTGDKVWVVGSYREDGSYDVMRLGFIVRAEQ